MAKIVMPDGSKKSFPGVVFIGGKYYARIHTADGYRYLGSAATPEEAHAKYVAAKRDPSLIPPRKNYRGREKKTLIEAMRKALHRASEGKPMSDDPDVPRNEFNFNRQTFALVDVLVHTPSGEGYGLASYALYEWYTNCRVCGVDMTFKRTAHDLTSPMRRKCDVCTAKEGDEAETVEDVPDDSPDEDSVIENVADLI